MNVTQAFHNKMVSEKMMFAFRGAVTEKNSLPLLTLIENEMMDDSYGITGRKRLFMFILESLQNIIKHGDHNRHADMSVVIYTRTEEGYNIVTGNMIESWQVEDLRRRLVQINTFDVSEIKARYLDILSNSELSKKGGAGLGLLEMAVKTGNKLDFDFIPFDEDFTYFILSKTVDSAGMGVNTGKMISSFKSDVVIGMERMMSENNVHMAWSGHVSPGVGEEVLSLTETRLSEEDIEIRIRKRIFIIMVEILENILKYNPGRKAGNEFGLPIALIRLEEGKFVLSTGNLIPNAGISSLKAKLDSVNAIDRKDLTGMFMKSLSDQTTEDDSTGNMGFIDIARKSGSILKYNFEPVNDIFSYYTLKVTVERTSD